MVVYMADFVSFTNQWIEIVFWLGMFYWSLVWVKGLTLDFFSLDNSFRVLNEHFKTSNDPLIKDSKQAEDIEIAGINEIVVKNISISFPGKLAILNNINFSAKKGEMTVVYGSTGQGKSLLVSVLARFLQPNKGEITIDGFDWNKFSDFQWRNSISIVNQPVRLFNVSIIQNIGFGLVPYEPQKIVAFCKQLGFDKYIQKFSNDYSTILNQNDGISAGQTQLIAIAAAIYRKPKLLVLDEPFAYMDKEMKIFCLDLLQKIKMDIPVLIFSGDISLKSNADKIFYLNNIA